MIDFRYHIVSLISVFLALAVGIALGAGPLEATIGNTLTEQVAALRAEKDALRDDLSTVGALSEDRADYVDAASDDLLAGVLPRDVAVVTLPHADDDVVAAVVRRLGQAGGTVTARVAITELWIDPDERTFRSSLVGNLAAYLDPGPAPDASTDAVLGLALARALTAPAPEDPGSLGDDAGLLLDVLTSGELVSVAVTPSRPADAVVVIGAPAGSATDADEAVAALVEMVDALAGESEGVVVGGDATTRGGIVPAVRASEVADRVASVDTIADITGQVSVPRALAAAIAGDVGHYGSTGSAADVLPPRVSLP